MKVFSQPCQNCLLSPDRIVSPERAKQIIQECVKDQCHFICHKASIKGEDICCRNFYDKLGGVSKNVRASKLLGIIQFVDQPEGEREFMPYKDLNDDLKGKLDNVEFLNIDEDGSK